MSLPRWIPELNTIYRAETLGQLSLTFTGGRTGSVDVLVGDADPPTALVGTFTAHPGASFSTVLRPGEFWTLVARTNRRGVATVAVRCVFTPFV